jgi:hypothetical protein
MSGLPRRLISSSVLAATLAGLEGFASATPIAGASAIRAAVAAPVETVQGYSYNNGPWDTGPAYGYPPYYGYGPVYPAPYAYAVPAPRYYVAPGPSWYGYAPGWRYRRAWWGRRW